MCHLHAIKSGPLFKIFSAKSAPDCRLKKKKKIEASLANSRTQPLGVKSTAFRNEVSRPETTRHNNVFASLLSNPYVAKESRPFPPPLKKRKPAHHFTHCPLFGESFDVPLHSPVRSLIYSFDLGIFRLISERENAEESYALEMSVCEIYNNEVRDLLAGKNASRVCDPKKHLLFFLSHFFFYCIS